MGDGEDPTSEEFQEKLQTTDELLVFVARCFSAFGL